MSSKVNSVSVIRVEETAYPLFPPFDPSEYYPEYIFNKECISSYPNYIYQGIRQTYFHLGFDIKHFGSSQWNPLGTIITPGDKVVLKPNFVMHENRSGHSINAVITHGSVMRALIDYVLIALKGTGEVSIVDAPQYDADYETIIELSGIKRVVEELKKRTTVPITLADLRVEQAIEKDGLVIERKKLKGDPHGYVAINLGHKSFFNSLSTKNPSLRGSDYDGIETIKHHHHHTHEYLIAKTILNADVVINIPKLKTHRKTGVTLCLKNLIGINGDKNWIPHFRLGGPLKDGDEHSSVSKVRDFECMVKDKFKSFVYSAGPVGRYCSRIIRKLQKSAVDHTHFFDIRGGSWHGNDTLWRSILDLTTILLYADHSGLLHKEQQRKYFCLIDGVIGGQGDGPYHTLPMPAGCLIAGSHPVTVDLVAIQFMGLNYQKIPKVAHALQHEIFSPGPGSTIDVRSNHEEWKTLLSQGKACVHFLPPLSWKGHIELENTER
jgi:uncharacterized protein (DUF362 family)